MKHIHLCCWQKYLILLNPRHRLAVKVPHLIYTRDWLQLSPVVSDPNYTLECFVVARDMVFYWEVKFYPPAPEQLNEDLTRYLVVLQVRQDLFNGRLPASFQTSALLGSYTAQGELGDFEKGTVGVEYLRSYSFAPKQSDELLQRISDIHRTHK